MEIRSRGNFKRRCQISTLVEDKWNHLLVSKLIHQVHVSQHPPCGALTRVGSRHVLPVGPAFVRVLFRCWCSIHDYLLVPSRDEAEGSVLELEAVGSTARARRHDSDF